MDTMSSAPHMNEDNAIRYLTNFGNSVVVLLVNSIPADSKL